MIVIGVDVHKHSLTAVAVDEVGRPLAERRAGRRERAAGVGARRWRRAAVGARGLPARDPRPRAELLDPGERLVRVPPRLTAPQRAAAARAASPIRSTRSPSPAALREPQLDRPRRRGAAAGAEAAGRSPRRSRRRAAPLPAAAALAPARARPDAHGAARRARPHVWLDRLARRCSAASRRRRCGSHATCSAAAAR